MITIFSTYVTLQIKEIHHPALFQEWKLNIDAAEYEKNMMANIYKPSEKINLIVLIVIKNREYFITIVFKHPMSTFDYDNVLGFGIPDILLNLLSRQGF